MTFEITAVFVIVAVAVVLFITEKLPVDLVALGAMALLLLTGILSGEEGLSGFSNEATITIAAMFILSAGLLKTGVVNYIGRIFVNIFRLNFWLAMAMMIFIAGISSAFINNTTQVAILLPVLLKVSKDTKISASKLLLPLSYATVFGGMLTLIGTSTNILVSSIAKQYGQPAFSMFEFTHVSFLFFLAGTAYMLIIGIRLVPDRRTDSDLTGSFGLGDYLTEIILEKDSNSVGKKIKDAPLVKSLNIDIIEIKRDGKNTFLPSPSTILLENDHLLIKCDVEKLKELQEMKGINLKPATKWKDTELQDEDYVLVEAIIAPHSNLINSNLKRIGFRHKYGGNVLAIRHRGRMMYENIADTRLLAGDALLIEIRKANLESLKDSDTFVVISEIETPTFKKVKMILSLAILVAVVTLASLDVFPISTIAVVGSILMVLTGCVSLEQAYKAVDWQVIMLLAGSISLGVALEKTGGAKLIAGYVVSTAGSFGPHAILAAFYLLTLILTETMSNNATAALMTPIAISTAASLGVDPRPLLITVMFAASLAFMMPVGYQTHLMIFNPGRYRIIDFIKVGTPLNIIFWIMAALLIPLFFPF